MASKSIEIVGARTHNLKNISVDIPQRQLTVITGPSGSGKSSLAFDTLYAEGQRRFVESMSTYARQFIEKMERPDVDHVRNIQPAIAIEQKNSIKNARSTIGTATEIHDYLRLLFAKGGTTICPHCDIPVEEDTPSSSADWLTRKLAGRRVYVVAPVPQAANVSPEAFKSELLRGGFTRIYTGGNAEGGRPFVSIEDLEGGPLNAILTQPFIPVVVDRAVASPDDRDRLSASLTAAFMAGRGTAHVYVAEADANIEDDGYKVQRTESGAIRPIIIHSGFRCNNCGREFRRPDPNMFSFNSPLGACPVCTGFGKATGVDWEKVFPNHSLTMNEDPVAPFNSGSYRSNYKWLTNTLRTAKIPFDVPLSELSPDQLDVIKYGSKDGRGVQHFFDELAEERYKVQSRITIARYRDFTTCPGCRGTRLIPEALNVYWLPEKKAGFTRRNIGQLNRMSIRELLEFWESVELTSHEEELIGRVFNEIRARLIYLSRVGLDYLSLDRQARTLSGGEAQRINLATALGTALTRTLYVLDEPTVGLHPRDSRRLLGILRDLRNKGNTLVVVEHDPELILGADNLIDIGPAAGSHGGELMFSGTPGQLLEDGSKSLTAQYLQRQPLSAMHNGMTEPTVAPKKARKKTKVPETTTGANSCHEAPAPFITIVNAHANNLKNVTVSIPLHKWVCITGVSGSGKSTLIHDVLYKGFNKAVSRPVDSVGAFEKIEGIEKLYEVLLVDQSTIGRSTRSNPVTYVKAYDVIRKLMASSRDAKARGIKESDFSFNVPGGRCERCEGSGVVVYDMHFLAEVALPCDVCGGKRFLPSVLEVRWRERNIDDILGLTVDDAAEFFVEQPAILRRLEPLREVGLGYLTLGQNTSTLSGGEAQRLKLASFLSLKENGRGVMMIFDEPTTGLHLSDLDVLSKVFRRLVKAGYSLVIIEHNLEIIRQADWIIDLGPEAGSGGGQLVACGSPLAISQATESHTGQFLREMLPQ